MSVADKVIISICILNQSVGFLLDTVKIIIAVISTCQKHCNTVFTTVVIRKRASRKSTTAISSVIESGDSGLHIAIAVKEISLAINFIRSGRRQLRRHIPIVTGTIPVTRAVLALCPRATGQTTVFKVKRNSLIIIMCAAQAHKRFRIKAIPYVINCQPTTGQLSANNIVVLAINVLQAGFVGNSAAVTNELVTGNFKCMTGSGNRGAPFYNGVTNLAEGSVGITVFRTGRSLVGKCCGSMNVGRAVLGEIYLIHICHDRIHFGIYMEFLVGEGACGAVNIRNQTHINIHLHILCPERILRPVGFGSIAGCLDIRIEVKNTNGKLCENRFAAVVVHTGTGNGNGCGIGFFVNGISCGEALRKLHIIELPMVDVVQVNHGFNLLNGFDSGCFKVHPVNRTEINSVKGRICGNERKRRIG